MTSHSIARQANEAWDRNDWPLFDQLLAAQHNAREIDAICASVESADELEQALEALAFTQRIGAF